MKKKLGKILISTGAALWPLAAMADTATELSNPLSINDPKLFIARLLRYALGFLGIVGLIMILYGGFLMLTSAGNADTIKKAKSTIIWAAVGIAVVIGSWQILSYIFSAISQVQ
ncbi:hypothetical protein C4546_02420 [Candidatus Parcubacteria bacterium]|jgi:hypothetical protein|nr:MAG: hypothetical protein C4546_02420 [Candidatus Parcubacteria bacterium]